jgi:chromosome segregation ATPase
VAAPSPGPETAAEKVSAEEARRQVETAGRLYREAEQALQSARQRFHEAEQALQTAQQQARHTTEQFHEAEQLLHAAKEHSADLQQQLQGVGQEFQAARTTADATRHQYEEAGGFLTAAREQAGAMKQQLAQAEEELQAARQYLQTTKEQSKEARLEYQEAEMMLQSAKRQASFVQQQIPEVEKEFKDSIRQVYEAKKEFAQAEQDLQTARGESTRVRQRFQEVWQELGAAQLQLEEIRRQVEDARQEQQAILQAARQTQATQDELGAPAGEAVSAEQPPGTVQAEELEAAPKAEEPEAVPKPEEEGELVYGYVRKESRQDRLGRYLSEAWAVEKDLADTLRAMARDVFDPEARALFEEQQQLTRRHQEALEARLHALGKKPSGGKGFFQRLAASICGALHQTPDDFDKATQFLMKGYAAAHFELAMYEALESYARTIGDAETADLAGRQSGAERDAAQRVWALIAPAAARTGLIPDETADQGGEPAANGNPAASTAVSFAPGRE